MASECFITKDTSPYHTILIKDIRGNILGNKIPKEYVELPTIPTKLSELTNDITINWNNITNKPGMYDKEETITLIDNVEITTTKMLNGYGYIRSESNIKTAFANTYMKSGDKYIIVFDGITYYKPSSFNTPFPANYPCLGNEYIFYSAVVGDANPSYDTGEPFAFDEYGEFCCVEDQPGVHTLSIYELTGETISVQIPEKYIPETIATKQYVDDAIAAITNGDEVSY